MMEYEFNHLISGQVIPDIDNAVAYATRIALNSKERRSCGIAIANCTTRKLMNARSHIYAGRIVSKPSEIKPNCTGLVCAEKTYGSSWGAIGLITYEIADSDQRLQIYYNVPMQPLWLEAQANVTVGFKTASKVLFEDMSNNLYGRVILARNTMRSTKNVQGYDVDFQMEDSKKSPLVVYLRRSDSPEV